MIIFFAAGVRKTQRSASEDVKSRSERNEAAGRVGSERLLTSERAELESRNTLDAKI